MDDVCCCWDVTLCRVLFGRSERRRPAPFHPAEAQRILMRSRGRAGQAGRLGSLLSPPTFPGSLLGNWINGLPFKGAFRAEEKDRSLALCACGQMKSWIVFSPPGILSGASQPPLWCWYGWNYARSKDLLPPQGCVPNPGELGSPTGVSLVGVCLRDRYANSLPHFSGLCEELSWSPFPPRLVIQLKGGKTGRRRISFTIG